MAKTNSQNQSIKFFQFLAKKGFLREGISLLFTEDEFDDIAKRVAVLGLYKADYSQRDIAETVGVSLSFVTRTLARMRYAKADIQTYAKTLAKK